MTNYSMTTSATAMSTAGLMCDGNNDSLILHVSSALQIWEQFNSPALWIRKVSIPVWYCLGISGNCMAAAVWNQRRMRLVSSGIYLSALAVCHMLLLLLHIPYALQELWGYNTLNYVVICNIWPPLFYTLQYSSPGLVLCFTVERYISVCHPFRRESLCTPGRAKRVTCGVLALCFFFASPQAYFYYYRSDHPMPKDRCTLRKEVYDPEGTAAMQPFAVWALLSELLVFGVVPLITLTFNIIVLREARNIRRKEPISQSSKQGHRKATTVTLLCVSFYHIASVLPVTVLYVLAASIFKGGDLCVAMNKVAEDPVWKTYFAFQTADACIFMLCFSHYAVNFYIYLLTGEHFRQTFTYLVYRVCCPSKALEIRGKTLETEYKPMQITRTVQESCSDHSKNSRDPDIVLATYTPKPLYSAASETTDSTS